MDTVSILFLTMSIKYGLPPDLLSSLCWIESRHTVNAVHHDDGGSDSLGICQIKYDTAKSLGFRGTAKQLMEPKYNIKYAALYLSKQVNRYNSIERGVIAYNRGNAKGLTTSKYQRKVFRKWRKA